MKVLLVNPLIPGRFHLTPPLGLGYIGSALRKRGHEVRIFDYCLKRRFEDYRPDWIGITGVTPQYPGMKELARWGKALGATVVMGGIHASSLPEFVLRDCPEVDYVIKGEGEVAFPDLVEGKVGPGVHSRDGFQESSYVQDLDSLASPWKTLDLEDYSRIRVYGISTRRYPVATILSSRGCPYGCTFCSTVQVHGKRVRKRSSDNFLDELEYLVRERGIREIQILDDNFTFDYDHATTITQGIIDRKLDFCWCLPNGLRADRVDRKLLSLMKRSGCYYFGVGIESGSPKILEQVQKGLSLSKVRETLIEADKLGFITHGFFMVGLPDETQTDIQKTIEYASSLPLDRISVNPVMPLPGSVLFAGITPTGDFDWLKIDRGEGLLPVAIKGAIRKLYIRFYLNPKRLYKHIVKIRSLTELIGLFVGFGILLREISKRHA